jgi:hypothetical protein
VEAACSTAPRVGDHTAVSVRLLEGWWTDCSMTSWRWWPHCSTVLLWGSTTLQYDLLVVKLQYDLLGVVATLQYVLLGAVATLPYDLLGVVATLQYDLLRVMATLQYDLLGWWPHCSMTSWEWWPHCSMTSWEWWPHCSTTPWRWWHYDPFGGDGHTAVLLRWGVGPIQPLGGGGYIKVLIPGGGGSATSWRWMPHLGLVLVRPLSGGGHTADYSWRMVAVRPIGGGGHTAELLFWGGATLQYDFLGVVATMQYDLGGQIAPTVWLKDTHYLHIVYLYFEDCSWALCRLSFFYTCLCCAMAKRRQHRILNLSYFFCKK